MDTDFLRIYLSASIFLNTALLIMVAFLFIRQRNSGPEVKSTRHLTGAGLDKFRKSLSGNSRFLQSLLDSIPSPVFYKDTEGRYLGCNREFEKFTGFKSSELFGRSVFDFVPDSIADLTHEKDMEVINNDKMITYEATVQNANKEHMEVIYYKNCFHDESGKVAGLIGVMIDITSNKRVQEELKNSEEKLRRLNEIKDRYLDMINSEFERAADHVTSLLPRQIMTGNIVTRWLFFPSSQLGGDAFGYHWIDDEHFAVYLLDVSGHGVGPALHSVSVLNVLRFHTLPDTDFKNPVEVMHSLNKSFQMTDHNDLYFTLWYGVFNKRTRLMKYGGAGHPAPLMISPAGKPVKLFARNLFIGAVEEYDWKADEIAVPEDSDLFIFSDGTFELKDKNGLPGIVDNLYDFLLENYRKCDSEIDDYFEKITEFPYSRLPDDDFSMLKVTFK
jgi:sigma-B regulation protein RsbU (phosphoserine phosphatase)